MKILSKLKKILPASALLLVVTVVAASLVALPALAADAASVQSITISPTSSTPTIDPGANKQDTIRVLNGGTQPITVKLSVNPYRVTGEDYDQSFTALPGAPNIVDWVHLEKTDVAIAGNSQQDIKFTINVPAGTKAGGYYAVIFAETQGNPSPKTGVVINQRVGSLVYLTVSGDVKTEGKVMSWGTKTLQKQPLTASLRVANTGNNHFPVTLNATVKDVFGRTKYTQTTTKEVLPQTIRNIAISWPGTPPVGLVKVGGTIEYMGKTETLANKYVLVVSPTVRLAVGLFVAAVIVWFASTNLSKRKQPRKK